MGKYRCFDSVDGLHPFFEALLRVLAFARPTAIVEPVSQGIKVLQYIASWASILVHAQGFQNEGPKDCQVYTVRLTS